MFLALISFSSKRCCWRPEARRPDEKRNQKAADPIVLLRGDSLIKLIAITAGANIAQNDGSADVDFEGIKEIGEEHRLDFRMEAQMDRLELAPAGRTDRLKGDISKVSMYSYIS
jgi:hypothetical protein